MAGTVICSKCGRENSPDQTFCASCGAFLEWSGEKVVGEPQAEATVPADAEPRAPIETEPAGSQSGAPAQPPLVAPVRAGPSRRSVPASPSETASGQAQMAAESAPAVRAPDVAAEPTISCPSCGRANPISRNFCHSCGTLLRPKPPGPMARRRGGTGGAGAYRIISIILLVAIILIGSFLLTRLTTGSGGAGPSPSPSRGLVTRSIDG